jgi:hypothetical protein
LQDIMASPIIVRMEMLYPSKVRDLSKFFSLGSSILRPYDLAGGDVPVKRQIRNLVLEVEQGLNIQDPKRRNGPYDSQIHKFVDAVNSTTSLVTDDPARQIPQKIRFLQLAHLSQPSVDGYQFSYGLMAHYGMFANLDSSPEFAILLPYEKDVGAPALMLSNCPKEEGLNTLGRIVKALNFVRNNPSK